MNREILPACPRVEHEDIGSHILDLLNHIEFAQAVKPATLVLQRFELLAVRSGQLANGMQPVVDEPPTFTIDGGADATAAVMSDNHNVLHFEDVDGKLEHGQIIGILRRSEIGDVAVDEQLAGVEPDNGIRRHSAIGAADPEIMGRLLAFEPPEEVRILRDHPRGPGAVSLFQVVKQIVHVLPERTPNLIGGAKGSRTPDLLNAILISATALTFRIFPRPKKMGLS